MQSEGTPISARHSQMLLSFDDYAGPARTSPLFNNLPEAAAEEVVEEAAPRYVQTSFRGELLPRTPVGDGVEQVSLFENAAPPPVRSNAPVSGSEAPPVRSNAPIGSGYEQVSLFDDTARTPVMSNQPISGDQEQQAAAVNTVQAPGQSNLPSNQPVQKTDNWMDSLGGFIIRHPVAASVMTLGGVGTIAYLNSRRHGGDNRYLYQY